MMRIHCFKRKMAVYVINCTKNPSIFKIKRDENIFLRHLCMYTLITNGLKPIKLILYKELLYNLTNALKVMVIPYKEDFDYDYYFYLFVKFVIL